MLACRYMIGVLDKEAGTMELHNTDVFHMTPYIKGMIDSVAITGRIHVSINISVQAHGFSKKWLRNHPKFLLHFLIHIDVFMLHSRFELIPTSIF